MKRIDLKGLEEEANKLKKLTELKNEIATLRAENERLRQALIPIAKISFYYGPGYADYDSGQVRVGTLRRARAALKGDE